MGSVSRRSRRRGGSTAAALAAPLLACLWINPSFSPSDSAGSGSGAHGTTRASSGADTELATGAGSSGGGSGSAGATSLALTSSETADSTSTTGSTNADTGTTQPPEPKMLALPADLAVCVVPEKDPNPYIGPQLCEVKVGEDFTYPTGMIADAAWNHVGGRTVFALMSFTVPPAQSLLQADLVLHVAPDAEAGSVAPGVLSRFTPFTGASLDQGPPEPIPGLDLPLAANMPGQEITIPLPPAMITLGAPLHLGVVPFDPDSVIFANNNAEAPLRPVLRLLYLE